MFGCPTSLSEYMLNIFENSYFPENNQYRSIHETNRGSSSNYTMW